MNYSPVTDVLAVMYC